jgi:hypothetical protein
MGAGLFVEMFNILHWRAFSIGHIVRKLWPYENDAC